MPFNPGRDRPLIVERRGGGHRQKHPMPKWSHQRELESMIGKNITLTFNAPHLQPSLSGMLTAADSFTIQLAGNDKSVMTYFKHSIRGYALAKAE
jgi:hypothetical protein